MMSRWAACVCSRTPPTQVLTCILLSIAGPYRTALSGCHFVFLVSPCSLGLKLSSGWSVAPRGTATSRRRWSRCPMCCWRYPSMIRFVPMRVCTIGWLKSCYGLVKKLVFLPHAVSILRIFLHQYSLQPSSNCTDFSSSLAVPDDIHQDFYPTKIQERSESQWIRSSYSAKRQWDHHRQALVSAQHRFPRS